jgi:hypothetical protein
MIKKGKAYIFTVPPNLAHLTQDKK